VNNLPANIANGTFEVVVLWTIRAIGSSAANALSGTFSFFSAPTTYQAWQMVKTSAASFDTTASATPDVQVQWGTASSGNSITAQVATIEVN
jgi:hypothetical protein